MKHKNAEMIIAKVNNTELVVLVKAINSQNESDNYWTVRSLSALSVAENEFFLCLPQHKQACLHWLNGGCVQTRRECSDLDWDSLLPFNGEWVKVSHFMCVDNLLRIKPKKEKRWIVAGNNSLHTMMYFHSKSDAELYNPDGAHVQVIEIEVEV